MSLDNSGALKTPTIVVMGLCETSGTFTEGRVDLLRFDAEAGPARMGHLAILGCLRQGGYWHAVVICAVRIATHRGRVMAKRVRFELEEVVVHFAELQELEDPQSEAIASIRWRVCW